MTTDIGIREHRDAILQPLTGELVPADSLPGIADALVALREHRNQITQAIGLFSDAAAEIARIVGTRTLVADGGVHIEVSPDHSIEWDIEELEKLRDLGLPEARYNQLVTQVISYKVDGRIIRQLEGASEEYKAVIERARVRIPKRQYASVK